MRLSAVVVFAVVTVSPAMPGWSVARADGVSCQSHLDLGGLVEQSRSILLVEVVSTNHRYGVREAYGRKERYLQEYRFETKLVEVVRGKAPAAGERLSVRMRGGPIPGRWVVVRECYSRTVELETVKPGTRLLAFSSQKLSQAPEGEAQEPVDVEELEDAKVLPRVEQAVRKAPRGG